MAGKRDKDTSAEERQKAAQALLLRVAREARAVEIRARLERERRDKNVQDKK